MLENATIFLRKIDLDLSCLTAYEQRGCYLKLLQYLYPLRCVSPDVTDLLSRMQNVYLKSVQLVGEIVTCVAYFMGALICVPFYLCFPSNLCLVFCGSFLAYSMMMVLLYWSLGDSLNATLWIASYLWLNVTKGSVGDVCMFCSHVAASVVLGMPE